MNVPVLSLLLRRFSLRHARLAPRATALLVGILDVLGGGRRCHRTFA